MRAKVNVTHFTAEGFAYFRFNPTPKIQWLTLCDPGIDYKLEDVVSRTEKVFAADLAIEYQNILEMLKDGLLTEEGKDPVAPPSPFIEAFDCCIDTAVDPNVKKVVPEDFTITLSKEGIEASEAYEVASSRSRSRISPLGGKGQGLSVTRNKRHTLRMSSFSSRPIDVQ